MPEMEAFLFIIWVAKCCEGERESDSFVLVVMKDIIKNSNFKAILGACWY